MSSKCFKGSRVFLILLLLLAVVYLSVVLPPFAALDSYLNRRRAVEIFDSSGNPLYTAPLEEGMRREYRPLDEIPRDLRDIFIKTEDKRFFLHPGVDPVALSRAGFRFLVSGETGSGASTITMQLARMVLNSQDDRKGGRFPRKLQEIVAAVRIEARLDKDEILAVWLNTIPFGYQTEGVVSAARRFFNQDLYSLTSSQALALALIPRNPTVYNPVTNSKRVIAEIPLLARRLDVFVDPAKISRDIASAGWGTWPGEAPHFSRMVSGIAADDEISRVTTTLRLDVQRAAEELLYVYLDSAVESRIQNGAVLVVENESANILAHVGSQRFAAAEGGQIDGVQVRNQPGSTIKPFLYAFALEQGFSPNDVIADIPTDYGASEVYVPRNFDRSYHGPVRLRTALASSLNIPATTTLEGLGVETFLSFLTTLGFDFTSGGDAAVCEDGGLGAALGNVPVTLYELVRAFTVFQRGGVYRDLNWRTMPDNTSPASQRVMSETTAWLICDMLSDPAERVTGFGMTDPFKSRTRTAVKTGTSSRSENIWALASTAEYTVGVWLGNFSGATVIGRTGSSVPAAIALEVLSYLGRTRASPGGTGGPAGYGKIAGPAGYHTNGGLAGAAAGEDGERRATAETREPAETRATAETRAPATAAPRGIREIEICTLSGMRAGPNCPATRRELITGEPPPVCTYHVSSQPVKPAVYPAVFASWAESTRNNASFLPSDSEGFEFSYPLDGAVYFYDRALPAGMQAVRVEVIHGGGARPVLYVNGEAFSGSQYAGNEVMTSWLVPLRKGEMVFEARPSRAVTDGTVSQTDGGKREKQDGKRFERTPVIRIEVK